MITLKIIVFIFITTAPPPSGSNSVKKALMGKWKVSELLYRQKNKFIKSRSNKWICHFRKNSLIINDNRIRHYKWKVTGSRRIVVINKRTRKQKEAEIYFAKNRAAVKRLLIRLKSNPNLFKINILHKRKK